MAITTSDFNKPKEPQRVTRATDEHEVDRLIGLWHTKSSSRKPLHEYLGWTEDEYKQYVENGDIPQA